MLDEPVMFLGHDFRPTIYDRWAKWEKMTEELASKGIFRTDIWGGNAPEHPAHDGFKAGLWIYPAVEGEPRGMFIICAGGAFMFKSSNEAKPVAEYFHNAGINTAILDYSVYPSNNDDSVNGGPGVRLNAGQDALQAIRFLRANAEKYGINADRIAIGGFSAGGMTSQLAATMFDYGDPTSEDPIRRVSSRPDAVLLLYGAFANTLDVGKTGYDMKRQNMIARTDPVQNIGCDCPPVFIFQTTEDDTRSSIKWANELVNKGIPYEIHIFNEGPHGAGLYDGNDPDSPLFAHTARWAELAAEWLRLQGF